MLMTPFAAELYLLAWYMSEEGLWALTVIVPSMTHSTVGCPHCQAPAFKFTPASVAVFGCLIDDLVKCRVYVICKLDLCNWCAAQCSSANPKAHNALRLAQKSQSGARKMHEHCCVGCNSTTQYVRPILHTDLFRKRCVENPFFAKALQQACCTSENPTKADVFTKH